MMLFQRAAFAVLSLKGLLLSLTVLPLITQGAPSGEGANDGITYMLEPRESWHDGAQVLYSTSSRATATVYIDTSIQHWDTLTMDVGAYWGQGSTIGDGKSNALTNLGSAAGWRSFTIAIDGQTTTHNTMPVAPLVFKLDINHLYMISLSTDDRVASGLYVRSIFPSNVNGDPTTSTINNSTLSTTALTGLSTTSSTSSVSASSSTGTSSPSALTTVVTSTIDPSILANPSFSIGALPTNSDGNSNINASTGSSNSSNSSNNSKKTSTVVGVVLGLLALIVLGIFLVIMYRRKKQKDRIPPSMAYLNSYRDAPGAAAASTSTTVGGGEKAAGSLGLMDDPHYAGSGGAGGWGGNNASVIESGALFNASNIAGVVGAGAAYGAASSSSYTQRAPWEQPQQQQQGMVMPEDRYSAAGMTNLAAWPTPPTNGAVPRARAMSPDMPASPRAVSEVDMTANPYGGIEMATTPTPVTFAKQQQQQQQGTVLMQGNGMPTGMTTTSNSNVNANVNASPYGNPFLGPSEENMAGRGAGHWNRANAQ
ncbi:hypothetical protein FRC18_006746 [Serendipita sp. 400]|nr:hypothetical protein FRC18_006746 [Serendipita sp. 400]